MAEPNFDMDKKSVQKPKTTEAENPEMQAPNHPLSSLQQQVGNQAVQRLIQRSGGGSNEIDDETAGRINANRGGGQSLDSSTQDKMGTSMGYDFSNVRVHTSPESDQLNKSVGAKAFTTGSDIFFSQGSYDPGSTGGKELLAHELTHVVQQGTGKAGGGGGPMTVNTPGDRHEQEADSIAESISNAPAAPVQMQEEDELEVQTKRDNDLQMQEEEELEIQTKRDDHIQMEEAPEEELQMQEEEEAVQMQEEEEEAMP